MSNKDFIINGFGDKPMAATLYQNEEKNAPVVIYAHGINGFKDWGGMPKIAELFKANGFHFLSFNFSHSGTTPEHPEEFIDLDTYGEDSYLKRQFDLQQVVKYVKGNLAKTDVYLIGHSRGGTDVILFAAQSLDVKKVVSWAAPAEAKTPWASWDIEKLREWKKEGVMYRKNGRTQQQMPINYSLREEYIQNKEQLSVYKAAQKLANKPWLIVHGEDDEAVFVKNAYTLKESQSSAQVAILPGIGHTFGRTHPDGNHQDLPKASVDLARVTCDFLKHK